MTNNEEMIESLNNQIFVQSQQLSQNKELIADLRDQNRVLKLKLSLYEPKVKHISGNHSFTLNDHVKDQ